MNDPQSARTYTVGDGVTEPCVTMLVTEDGQVQLVSGWFCPYIPDFDVEIVDSDSTKD